MFPKCGIFTIDDVEYFWWYVNRCLYLIGAFVVVYLENTS